MLLVLALLLPLSSPSARAPNPDETPTFDIDCQAFRLHFQSKSGEVSEDDFTITLKQGGKEMLLPLKPGWYKLAGFVRDVKKLPRVCRATQAKSYDFDYPAVAVGDHRTLLFFRVDGRPGFSHLSALLYDTKEMKVLDVKEEIASLKDHHPTMRATKDGVEVRLVRDWLENTGCDCAESAIEDWNPIRVKDGKIELGWKASKF